MRDIVLTETPLEADRVSKVHRSRLQAGWLLLSRYLLSQKYGDGSDWLENETFADQVMANFVNNCFLVSVPLWKARFGFLAAQTQWRFLRFKLPRAWDAIQSWQQKRPAGKRLPINQTTVHTMFVCAISIFFEGRSRDEFLNFAIVLLVGFYALLRPTEFLHLKVGDLQFSDSNGSRICIVAIVEPKNKRAFGQSQYVIIDWNPAVRWLEWFVECKSKPQGFWPSNARIFSQCFAWMLQRLDVPVRYTAASLRAGATTYYHIQGVPIPSLKYRGRWASEKSMPSYVKESMAALVWNQIDPIVVSRMHAILDSSAAILAGPPRKPLPICRQL